jgi:hypothetical protein
LILLLGTRTIHEEHEGHDKANSASCNFVDRFFLQPKAKPI